MFASTPGPFAAGDLLAQAIVTGYRSATVQSAAEYIARGDQNSPAVVQLAGYVLADRQTDALGDAVEAARPFDIERARLRARDMRRIVRAQPRNAVRWVDLALSHVNLGQLKQAARDMRIAVALAPENRFVLRSAARLHHLMGEPDRAHWLLSKSGLWLTDPWIQSAEIAIAASADLRPRSLRQSRDLLARGDLSPRHTSELAAELATAELTAGKTRPARKLMGAALVDPTENSVAQAEWASRHGTGEVAQALLRDPRSFEARARYFGDRGAYGEALREALRWQADQPFAAEPAIFVSYIATVAMDSFELAIESARRALISNPTHSLLRNNLVFALACSGRLDEAELEFEAIGINGIDSNVRPTLDATRGLLAFRRGNPEVGRRHYEAALRAFSDAHQPDRAALARLFLAREELLANSPRAAETVETALVAYRRAPKAEVSVLAERIVALSKEKGIAI